MGQHHANAFLGVVCWSPATICRLERFDGARFLLRRVSGSCDGRCGCSASTYLAAGCFCPCGMRCCAFLGFLAHNNPGFLEERSSNSHKVVARKLLCKSHFFLASCRAQGFLTDAIEALIVRRRRRIPTLESSRKRRLNLALNRALFERRKGCGLRQKTRQRAFKRRSCLAVDRCLVGLLCFRVGCLALGANSRFLRVEFRFTSRESRVLRLVLSRGGGPQTYTLHDQIEGCCHVLVVQCFYFLRYPERKPALKDLVEKSAGCSVRHDVAVPILADIAVGIAEG